MSGLRSRLERIERDTAPESDERVVFHVCERINCPKVASSGEQGASHVEHRPVCPECGHFAFTLKLDGPPDLQERIANVRRGR